MKRLVLATLVALIVAVLAPPQTHADYAWPIVRTGNTGANVSAVQHLLTSRGHTTTADGAFGSGTETNVRNFQSSQGLTADGIVGSNTWTALISTVQSGSTGSAVRAAQVLLNKYGYGLAVDGQFGSGTASATRSFQSREGLTSDGVVGPTTWRYLAGASAGSGTGEWRLMLPQSAVARSEYDDPHHDYPALDLPAAAGTPSYAVTSGTATAVNDSSCGIGAVLVANNVRYSYCHFSSRAFSGTISVSAGQTLGYVGTTGSSTGNHLHFQIRTLSDNLLRCPQSFALALYDGVTPPSPTSLPTSGCSN